MNEKQLHFINYVRKENRKEIDVNNANEMIKSIVLNLFEMYLIADSHAVKREVAYRIHTIRDDIKRQINFWHLINRNEFIKLVNEQLDINKTYAINKQKRRHEKRDDFALSDEEWNETLKYFRYQCAYCGSSEKLTYDHFYPFSKGGDFMKGNIIPCCKSCNSSKNSKLFEEWYKKQTFYSKIRENKILKYIEFNRQLALL